MKKVVTALFLIVMFVATACGSTPASTQTATNTPTPTITPTATNTPMSTETFIPTNTPTPTPIETPDYMVVKYHEPFDSVPMHLDRIQENLQYVGDEPMKYQTPDGEYIFRRFNDFISIDKDEGYSVILSGENFIVTEDDKLWYVNMDRKITCFRFAEHDFSIRSEEEEVTNVFDIWADETNGIEPVEKYFKYCEAENGKLAVATIGGTLVCDDTALKLQKYDGNLDYCDIPFSVQELKFLDYRWRYGIEAIKYAATLENGYVITITVDSNNSISVRLIHNGRKTQKVRLLTENESNHIDSVKTEEDFVFFYIDDTLHLGDGEWDFIIDEFPWTEVWYGDWNGVGKDVPGAGCFLAYAEDDTWGDKFQVEKELNRTGINY